MRCLFARLRGNEALLPTINWPWMT